MSDHERNPNIRRSEGPANPHPGADMPKATEPARRLHVFGQADIEAVRAAWLELGDPWLVSLRFPGCWRGAVVVVIRLMEAERHCAACPFECREPGNPECYRLRDKLPVWKDRQDE